MRVRGSIVWYGVSGNQDSRMLQLLTQMEDGCSRCVHVSTY